MVKVRTNKENENLASSIPCSEWKQSGFNLEKRAQSEQSTLV